MRRKALIWGATLSFVMIIAFASGISRLGQTDLSPRALRTASRWTARAAALSERAEEIADGVIPFLDLSDQMPDEDLDLEPKASVIVRDQIVDALRERRAKWSYGEAFPLGYAEYRVQCSTTLPVDVYIRFNRGAGPEVFEATWSLHVEIELDIDADRRKVTAWRITPDTILNTE
jgi:hypothetical protein